MRIASLVKFYICEILSKLSMSNTGVVVAPVSLLV